MLPTCLGDWAGTKATHGSLVGNDNRTHSGWVCFILHQVIFVPELPKNITGKIKVVNFGKRSLVTCNQPNTQKPLCDLDQIPDCLSFPTMERMRTEGWALFCKSPLSGVPTVQHFCSFKLISVILLPQNPWVSALNVACVRKH